MVPIINWYRPKMPDYNVNIPLIIWCHGCALFSTINHDNDILSGKNCAVSYRGAWWYQACFSCNLNGPHIPIRPIPSLTPWQHDLLWLRFWLTWLKFSWSEANPWKLRKFYPTKISRHTVYIICRTGAHASDSWKTGINLPAEND